MQPAGDTASKEPSKDIPIVEKEPPEDIPVVEKEPPEDIPVVEKEPSEDIQVAEKESPEDVIINKKKSKQITKEISSDESTNALNQLENLITESLQIYELENQKASTIDELVNSLKIVTEFLNFTVKINPEIFALNKDTSVTLSPQLELIFRKSDGKTEVKSLDAFSLETLTKILENAFPQLVKSMRKEKDYLSKKIFFLRAATKQLKQLHNLKEGPVTESSVVPHGELS